MEIRLLADHLDLIPTIARWHFAEWGHGAPSGSLPAWIARIAYRTNRDHIPLTYIAFVGGDPAGTAMLLDHDMDTHQDLTPWLGGVFVVPHRRRQGIASALIRRTADQAYHFGYRALYLYTNGAEPLYESLGWLAYRRETYEGREVTIMKKAL